MRRVFLDTAPLIYLAEGDAARRERVLQQLTQWIETGATLGTSTLTLLELLVVPKREKKPGLERKYRALLHTFLSAPPVELSAEIADRAAGYRATLQLRTPDAIQVASAVQMGFDVIYTNDLRLRRCEDIDFVFVDA